MPPKRLSLKSRAELPTGNAALYKGRNLSNIHPNALLREAGRICWFNFITHQAFCQCLSAGSLSPSGCNGSVLQCPAAGAAQHTAVRLSCGLPSQAVHVLSRRLSAVGQVLAAQGAALHEPPPQAAPSQKGCGSCPALRTILPMTAKW